MFCSLMSNFMITTNYNSFPQSGSSRLPGMGVEQFERTVNGEGERDSDWMGARVWGGARVFDSTRKEGTESCDGRLDLSFPAEGDLSPASGRTCSGSSGIVLGPFFFFFVKGLSLLFCVLFLFWLSWLGLERPTSLASQRHLSISCSCIRLMHVDNSAIPGQEHRATLYELLPVFNIMKRYSKNVRHCQ